MDKYQGRKFNDLSFNELYDLVEALHEKMVFLGLKGLSIDTRFFFHYENGKEERRSIIYVEGKVPMELVEKFGELRDHFNAFNFVEEEGYGMINQAFVYRIPSIPQIEGLTNIKTGQPAVFKNSPEEVTGMFVWSAEDMKMCSLLSKSEKLLDKIPDWRGKCRLVALNVDEDIQTAKDCVALNKWDDVDHYFVNERYDNSVLKSLDIKKNPKYISTKKGKSEIEYICNPLTTDFELKEDFMEMFDGHSPVVLRAERQWKSMQARGIFKEDQQKVLDNCNLFVMQNKALIDQTDHPVCRVLIINKTFEEFTGQASINVLFQFTCHDNLKDQLSPLVDQFKENQPEHVFTYSDFRMKFD